MTDYSELEVACRNAMQAAKESPGRYGGRYVARRYHKPTETTVFAVLDDDDPDLYRDDEDLDILAQVTPTKVLPIGHARHWLNEDGTVTFHD